MEVGRLAPTETHGDLADTMTLLDVESFANEANSLCAQIQAIEENVAEGLRTEPAYFLTDPIVAALFYRFRSPI